MISFRATVSAIALLSGAACNSSSDASHTQMPAVAAAPAPAASAVPAPAAASSARPSNPLRFTAQPGWTVETPASAMRKAQYLLPGADGAADASLVVYHFGPGG